VSDVLRLVVVNDDGSEGRHLGTLLRTDDDQVIVTGASMLDDMIEARVRAGSPSRSAVFATLLANGWSNGKLMLVAEGGGQ
jgi:hypothetical protein